MLHLNIQKELGSSLIKQIYEQIRIMIFNGELKAEEKCFLILSLSDAGN